MIPKTKKEISMSRKHLREQNRWQLDHLTPLPPGAWPQRRSGNKEPVEIWRSKTFLVQIYQDGDHQRLSCHRTEINKTGMWVDGITWEELMRLKSECGRGDRWAVEVYPPDVSVVNVANMRHLFLLPEAPVFAWKKEGPAS